MYLPGIDVAAEMDATFSCMSRRFQKLVRRRGMFDAVTAQLTPSFPNHCKMIGHVRTTLTFDA